MASERNSDLRYKSIPDAELEIPICKLQDAFERFLLIYCLPADTECCANKESLIEIVQRVDKRIAYYYCFHKMCINERKEVALYAYWLLKFRPFTIVDGRFEDDPKAALLNESFAIFLIAAAIVGSEQLEDIKFVPGSYVEKLQYSFRYRSFTIDSLMLLVESLSSEIFSTEYKGIL